MLYARAGIKLPLTGFTADLRANYIGYSDDKLTDIVARVNYEAFMGLGVEAGYRSMDLDIDEDGLVVDADFSGIYAGISYHF